MTRDLQKLIEKKKAAADKVEARCAAVEKAIEPVMQVLQAAGPDASGDGFWLRRAEKTLVTICYGKIEKTGKWLCITAEEMSGLSAMLAGAKKGDYRFTCHTVGMHFDQATNYSVMTTSNIKKMQDWLLSKAIDLAPDRLADIQAQLAPAMPSAPVASGPATMQLDADVRAKKPVLKKEK